MPLSCSCPNYGEPSYWYDLPETYTTAPLDGRRHRCSSCNALIPHGSVVNEFKRSRGPKNDIEARIYGTDYDIIRLAPLWQCEHCADLFWSLEELGFCVNPEESMEKLVKEYRDMTLAT